MDWHHLGAKNVFDPMDKHSSLNKLGLRLSKKVDIHSSQYGWMLDQPDHTGKGGVHHIENAKKIDWNDEQAKWLEKVKNKHGKGFMITKDMFDKHIDEMRKAYGLISDCGDPLIGRPATTKYPDLSDYMNKLVKAKRFKKTGMNKTAQAVLIRSASRSGPLAKALGVRVMKALPWVAATAGAAAVYARGGNHLQASVVAVVDGMNPIPISTLEFADMMNVPVKDAQNTFNQCLANCRADAQKSFNDAAAEAYKDMAS